MQRPPRNSRVDRLVSARMVFHVFQMGVLQTLCCYLPFLLVFEHYGIPASSLVQADGYFAPEADDFVVNGRVFTEDQQLDILAQAQSAYWVMLTGSQLLHIFLSKTRYASIFQHGFFNNVVMMYGAIIALVLIILMVFTPGIQDFFGTAAFPGKYWLCLFLVWGVFFLVYEGKRWFYRNHGEKFTWARWLVW
jgi:magnesium-transporting ATPase (P-type)